MELETTNTENTESTTQHGTKTKVKVKGDKGSKKNTWYASLELPPEEQYWSGIHVPKGKSPRTFLMVGATCSIAILLILFVFYMPNLDDATTTSSENPSSSSRKTTALIHMGPHKTGSSTVQGMSETFINELKEDGYHIPCDWVQDIWDGQTFNNEQGMVEFATCFVNPKNQARISGPCVFEMLLAGAEMGAEGKDMFVSAETFDVSDDDGLRALSAYLKIFDETVVVVFYRRYFEWLASVDNQQRKTRKLKDSEDVWNKSILSFIEDLYSRDEIKDKHTYNLVGRVEKHFENLELVNMHNEKDNNEELFCEVMPHADRTCEALKSNEDEIYYNPRVELIYEDLAYNAMKKGLIEIANDQELDAISSAVQEYQEETLGLTKYDFPLICLSPEVEEWLLDTSLMIEETLLPEFFKTSLGEEALRASFAEHAKTDLCKLDVEEAFIDDLWIDFFTTLNY